MGKTPEGQPVNTGGEYFEAKSITEFTITPESLYRDNHSLIADEKRNAWEESRKNHDITYLERCGDARYINPDPTSTVVVGSIASGGAKGSYERLSNDVSIHAIAESTHIDEDTIRPGETPTGCGGQGEKAQMLKKGVPAEVKGVAKYVKERVGHFDPVVQALLAAEKMAYHSEKPVLAVVQGHLTGVLFPIAIYKTRGGRTARITPRELNGNLINGEYDPKRIYENGIPMLDDNELPLVFRKLMDKSRRQTAALLAKYPDLRQHQKVQNPNALLLSTAVRPVEVRYPQTFGDLPGTVFQLIAPREKGTPHINEGSLETVLDQAEYPITHALENFGKPDLAFSKLGTVLIETRSLDSSRKIAEEMLKRHWMQEWHGLPNHQILVASTRKGFTERVEKF